MNRIPHSPRRHSAVALVRRSLVGYGLFMIAACFVFARYAVQLGCDVSWDLTNYHYYTPYALLNGRIGFDYAAAQIQTYLNPLSFVPFYVASTHLEPVQVGFLLGGVHGINFWVLFLLGRLLFSSTRALPRFALALSCAVLGTAGPLFLRQLGTSYNDILLTPLVLLALLLYLRSLLRGGRPERRWFRHPLALSSFLLGIAVGLKLVFLLWLVAFAFALLVVERGWANRFVALRLIAVGSGLGLLISRGYWMALLWWKFGSPLFPFYNAIFRSPLYHPINFADRRTLPESPGEALRLPLEASDGRVAVLFGAVFLALLFLTGRAVWARRCGRVPSSAPNRARHSEKRAAVFLTIFYVVGFILWEWKFSISRYLVPLELLAPLVAIAMVRISLPERGSLVLAPLSIGLAIVVLLQPVYVQRTEWLPTLFNVNAPRFEHPEEVLVILADEVPMSYVIPFFQPEVRFVCPWNNFTQTEYGATPPGIEREMVKVIRAHEGQIFALAPGNLRNVKSYGVAPIMENGRRKFDPQPLSFPEGDELMPPSSGLYLWPLELVARKTPFTKRAAPE